MIDTAVQNLIQYAIQKKLIAPEDELVIRNQLLDVLHRNSWEDSTAPDISDTDSIDDILAPLVAYACETGIIPDTNASRDLFDTKLMGILTALPHEVNAVFRKHYSESPESATQWYYAYNQALNYVRAGRIARDLKWTYDSPYGTLDITINRSKPEKDPRDIAAAGKQAAVSYPKCQLCPENAGFAGTRSHPARQNLRPIPISIAGSPWQFQYSPYGYYNEHCIVFNAQHVPMRIDHAVFEKLFDFLDLFPHYFIGSNADLPIVGGSILSHEHFQGGNYTFAMAKAPVETRFTLPDYPDVQAGTVRWPMSVIRLKSLNRTALSSACADILTQWRSYSDPAAAIYAETDGTPHNTITPIARMNGDYYECDLVLRNNRTTPERPLGLFHPGPALHHIKKENIGLIEVMGLAVLPARLANELTLLEQAMLRGDDLTTDPVLAPHAAWAAEVRSCHPEFSLESAGEILRQEVGAVFAQVLEDAGVSKRTPDGQAAFRRWIDQIRQA